MEKVRFNSMDEFTSWYNGKDEADVKKNPTVLKDKQFIALNMFTECKNWKAAFNQFADTFLEDYDNLSSWFNRMYEWAEKETFHQYRNDRLGALVGCLKRWKMVNGLSAFLLKGLISKRALRPFFFLLYAYMVKLLGF